MRRPILIATLLLALPLTLRAQTTDSVPGRPLYRMTLHHDDAIFGTVDLELFPDIAPLHARNFDSLVSIGFYDSTAIHRVAPGFVVQGGDPNSRSGPESTWGYGDPATQRKIPAEFNPVSHLRGIISAARTNDPNSATSQYFIVLAPATHLDLQYTVYGRVVRGMDVVDSIVEIPLTPTPGQNNFRPVTKLWVTIERTGIDTSIPATPSSLFPADDTARVRSTQTIRWSTVDGAILYEVQVAKSPTFEELEIHDSLTAVNTTLQMLDLGRVEYFWRVRATNGGRKSGFSEVRSFTTALAPARLAAPANNTVDLDTPVTLTWSPVPGATTYRVQVSPVLAFNDLVVDAHLSDTTHTVAGLESPRRFYWRVFATDGSSDTSQSSRWAFTVGRVTSAPIEETVLRDARVVTGSDGTHTLALDVDRPARAIVAIVDALGRAVVAPRELALGAGSTSIELATGELPSGGYIVTIETDGRMRSVRMTMIR